MAFTDKLKNIFSYFEIDDSERYEESPTPYRKPNVGPQLKVAPVAPISKQSESPVELRRGTGKMGEPESNIQRLNAQQERMAASGDRENKKSTIEIKFPKKYEDAPEIVNLLLDNRSVLIDFQYMSEQQARRCLDYLDGARSVLAANLKKVSATMWLLAPVNVIINIEELRSANPNGTQDVSFDFDMRR